MDEFDKVSRIHSPILLKSFLTLLILLFNIGHRKCLYQYKRKRINHSMITYLSCWTMIIVKFCNLRALLVYVGELCFLVVCLDWFYEASHRRFQFIPEMAGSVNPDREFRWSSRVLEGKNYPHLLSFHFNNLTPTEQGNVPDWYCFTRIPILIHVLEGRWDK